MKQFFKFTFASILGVFVAGIILMILFFVIISGIAYSSSKAGYTAQPKTVLHLKLKGELVERSQDNPLDAILGNYVDKDTQIGLDDILAAVKNAKEDKNIEGIYIESGLFSASPASIQEIRNALTDFKKSNKFIIAYGGVFMQSAYYLSALADKIILNPQGIVDFRGLSARPMFLKNTFDKLGIDMQIFKVGTFKSATEMFSENKMSDASREQITEYVHSIWNQILNDISADRKIPVDSLNSYADRMMTFRQAEVSLKCGLVDTLMYPNDVIDMLKEKTGTKKKDNLNLASISEAASIPQKKKSEKEKIAIVYAAGDIDNGTSSDGIVSSDLIKDLKDVREDENVKAVVLRVNSPGGSAYGSEQIWKEVEAIKAVKPIVVSMGDYAASGGYYISCAADYIIAQPTTLTGSIGIFGIIPNMSGLLNKIGVSFDRVNTNKFSDMPNTTRPMTADEKVIIQSYINAGYDTFVTRCADGRKKTKEEIDNIGQGHVWTGEKALRLGLIDALGNLSDAVAKAAELAEIEKYGLEKYPKKKSFFDALIEDFSADMRTALLKNFLGENYKQYDYLQRIQSLNYMQARLPFELDVK
ncbi:MAG: signal peptide peptidase SppA [Candidatus Azobacteroides sp.]|nr:signal peptide peptidase SppA [Candidatus Azobacteroides sp.]